MSLPPTSPSPALTPAAPPTTSPAPVTGLQRFLGAVGRVMKMGWTVRMSFTVVFWLIAIGLASLIDSKRVAVPALEKSLPAFLSEQIDLWIIGFVVVSLALTNLLTLFVPPWRSEIIRELMRIYYTIGAVAGAVSLFSSNWAQASFFYGFGVIIPWIFAIGVLPDA